MRNTKVIDPSLKKKINQNDEKLRLLYDKDFKLIPKPKNINSGTRNKSEQRKRINQDNSYSETQQTYNEKNKSPVSKNMTIDREDQHSFVRRIQKRMKFKRDKEEKKNNIIFNKTFNNVYKNLENKKKKTYNRDQVDRLVNRLYKNKYNHKHPAKEEEFRKPTTNLENEPDVEEFIERLEEDIKKRNENLENLKKDLEDNEKEKYTYKPKMCKGSKKYNQEMEEDFFERQKKFTRRARTCGSR